MSKRIIAAFLITCTMLSFAACQNSSQKDDRIEFSTRATKSEYNGYMSEPNQTIESTSGTTAVPDAETTEEAETTEPADTTASAESSETSAKPTAKALGKVKVTDAYKKAYGKNQFGKKASVRIPKITISGVDTKKLNKEIYNYCKKNAGNYCSCSYGYYIGKTYVSLFIKLQEEHDSSPAWYYRVYNISRSNGKKLSRKQMLKILKLSDKKFNSRVKKGITKYYKKMIGYTSKAPSNVKRDYKKATSSKYLNKAIPYLNSKGKVCYMIRDLPIPAGAGSYDHCGTC